jgi:hypothetical protein
LAIRIKKFFGISVAEKADANQPFPHQQHVSRISEELQTTKCGVFSEPVFPLRFFASLAVALWILNRICPDLFGQDRLSGKGF